MTNTDDSLSDLRGRIDEIDDALHDLIMQRADLVARIRDAKGGTDPVFFRPEREARILRRLLARHQGVLPHGVIVRMWREMMSAFVSLQGPFAVAVWEGEEGAYWDMARDHFGSGIPMRRHATPRGVVQAVAEGTAQAGVVPLPHGGEEQPWWPLLGVGGTQVRVSGALPLIPGGNSRSGDREAFVVATGPFDESGEDRSFLSIECAEALSRSRLTAALGKSGLTHRMIVEAGGAVTLDGRVRYLVEIEGYYAENHAALAALVEDEEIIEAARIVGGYAVPPGIGWDGSKRDGGR